MKTRIVQIGKSQAIRIPRILLEQTGLSGEVDISAKNNTLVIRSLKMQRAGWAAVFRKMAERGDDVLLDDTSPGLSLWDQDQWEW
jgi:antitoxin MazE